MPATSASPRPERTARPYPCSNWPQLRRSDQQHLRRLLQGLPRDWTPVLAQARTLLGAAVSLQEGPAELWSADDARVALRAPLTVATWLELEVGVRLEPLLCELAPELASQLVDRILGGDGQSPPPWSQPLDDLSAGVAGYLAARLCAASGAPLRARAILTDAAAAHAVLGTERVLVWPLALHLNGVAQGWLRVFIPERTALACAERQASGAARARPPRWLDGLRMRLCAHAARVSLRPSQLRALGPGDVVVPQRCSLAFGAQGLAGHATLHVIGTRHAQFRCTARGRELVLQATQADDPEESTMSQTDRIEPGAVPPDLAPLPADAPIELCLELARFSVRLDELSAMRAGQVLGTGVALGQRVTLSASGTALARGELVDVEGEIGIRILELGY